MKHDAPACAQPWAGLMLLLCMIFSGCAAAPLDYPRRASAALPAVQDTRLGRQLQSQLAAHPQESAFYLLDHGPESLVARLALIDAAQSSVDAQCFLLGDDVAGTLLVEHLFAAADRGARVRLLVDDWNQACQDSRLAAIGAHPNLQLRIYNPVGSPRWNPLTRPLKYALGPERTRRRMHNKAIIVDNLAAVVGGRNIADAYFAAGEDHNFGDLDLLAAGPIAQQISGAFDQYWNNRLAVPIEAFVDAGRIPAWTEETGRRLAQHHSAAAYGQYAQQSQDSDLIPRLQAGALPLMWAKGEFLYDSPEKTLASIDQAPGAYMVFRLDQIVQQAHSETLMISPYLVPGERGARWFRDLRGRDVTVKVLTNSLASTDEISTYGAYERYRAQLLRYGVQLFELRAEADGEAPRGKGPLRALHTKCLVLDRQVVFIGSLNLDRRSARLDTQDGIVVWSAELSARVAALFEKRVSPRYANQLMLRSTLHGSDEGGLVWVGQRNGKAVVYYDDPETGPLRRFKAWVLS